MKRSLFFCGALLLIGTLSGAVYEAEDHVADPASAAVIARQDASGGKCVRLSKGKAKPAVRWTFDIAEPGKYDLVLRVLTPYGATDSVWVSLDGAKDRIARFGEFDFVWRDLVEKNVALTAGKHTFDLKVRVPDLLVDRLEVRPATRWPKADLERFAAPPVYPVKGEHPRVLLRKQDVAVIRARLDHPENAAAWAYVRELAARPVLEKLDPAKHMSPCGLYSEAVRDEVQAKAFVWLMTGDRKVGENAVKSMLGMLKSTWFKPDFPDVTRQIGLSVFTVALVYDWCYPLMTPEERQFVIGRAEELCAQMEVGFPPVRQGNVAGHAGEAQIFRDLFCYGFAVYDECPEMYRVTAGRVFGELAEARRFFHKSGRHHQGNAYGQYRFAWELYGALAARRSFGVELFGPDAAERGYDWAYDRLPDGAMFPDGDNYQPERTFARFQDAAFFLYALTGSPLARAEYLRHDDPEWYRHCAVHYLVFNRPGIAPAKLDDLPLTHYFPMPLPAMTARSGWTSGVGSDTVVVRMVGAGYQFNNHQHADAGSFQIYHRGLVAPDVGQYRRYGTPYDWDFNKATISHNAMLIRDPAVQSRGVSVYTAGQATPQQGREAQNLTVMLTQGYQTGDTVSHAFGPDAKRPLYSHLKADLSAVYDKRVKRYFRSFVYLNTNDPAVPGVLTVFDHVRTARPEYEKIWCLNSYPEPRIAGNTVTSEWTGCGCSGQIKTVSLLPPGAKIAAGPALVFRGRKVTPPDPASPSGKAFRTEIVPAKAAEEDVFLTVLAVGKAGKPLPFEAKLLRGEGVCGTAFLRYAVWFSADASLLVKPFSLTVPAGAVRVAATDLAPGRWEVVHAGKVITRRKVPAADGTLWFAADKPGTYLFRPAEAPGPDTVFPDDLAVPGRK